MKNKAKDLILELWLSNEENLEFICERRNKWVIFLDKNKNIYIKVWDKYQLKKEFEIQKQFIDLKFQVAKILISFENEDYFVYTEDKLWEKVIWKEIKDGNLSYDKGFEKIYEVVKNYFIRQSTTININWDTELILKKNGIDLLSSEKLIDRDVYIQLISKLHYKINNCMYFTLTHWDFNSMNLFNNWIIDLEDSYNWPLWFDLVTLISHHYWFQVDGLNNRSMLFSFKREDIEKLLFMSNDIYSNDISETFDLCFILRAIWSSVWMQEFPEEQKYRVKRLKIYIEKFLKWESILDFFLNEVDEINKIIEVNKIW